MAGATEDAAGENPTTGPDLLWGIEGGCWLITTEDSTYRIDLDAMTVDRFRFPDPTSVSPEKIPTRPLREIVQCKVGKRGYWLLDPEGQDIETVEYFWQQSSPVISIDPTPKQGADHPKGTGE